MIYLDYAASAPMSEEAAKAFLRAAALPGNPASVHRAGQEARALLEQGRALVGKALGAPPAHLMLTGSATESINTVLLSCRGRLITSAGEHSAVLGAAAALEEAGQAVTRLPIDAQGRVSPELLEEALQEEAGLVSLQWVGNELGTVQDIAAFAALCRSAGVPLHLDAVQAPGVLPVSLSELGCTYASLSAHKWGGPKGVGFLYWESEPKPLIHGGGQEGSLRGGTQNAAGCLAAGVAAQEAASAQAQTYEHLCALQALLWNRLQDISGVWRNSPPPPQGSPRVLNVGFEGISGEDLLMSLDMLGVQASLGSACSAGTLSPSHVLLAAGLSEQKASASLRLSLGPQTSTEEAEQAARLIGQAVQGLRG